MSLSLNFFADIHADLYFLYSVDLSADILLGHILEDYFVRYDLELYLIHIKEVRLVIFLLPLFSKFGGVYNGGALISFLNAKLFYTLIWGNTLQGQKIKSANIFNIRNRKTIFGFLTYMLPDKQYFFDGGMK